MSSQDLDKLLGALREDTRGVEAPRHVEAALLTAFRTQARAPARHVWIPWAIAAAAMVAIVGGTGVWMLDQPVPAPPAVKLVVAGPAPAFATELPSKTLAVASRPGKRAARPRVAPPEPRAVPATAAATEVATDFMPLEDTVTLPPIESGHILRVQLPQSTMMRFGFPVNPDRMMEPVKADVVFGQDGIARAVRFVR